MISGDCKWNTSVWLSYRSSCHVTISKNKNLIEQVIVSEAYNDSETIKLEFFFKGEVAYFKKDLKVFDKFCLQAIIVAKVIQHAE